MRDILYLDKLVTPTQNKVLVRVDDTFDVKERNSGVILANAAHDEAEADSPGFNLSEFMIRRGVVERMPRTLTVGYDWHPVEGEISEGDTVYWPISRFFDYPVIKTLDDELFLIVDYFDIHAKREGDIVVPVNGFYLFSKQVAEKAILEYEYEEATGYYILEKMGVDVKYENDQYNVKPIWEEGDVCMLYVPPFKLEGDTSEEFDKEYYLAQKRHIRLAL